MRIAVVGSCESARVFCDMLLHGGFIVTDRDDWSFRLHFEEDVARQTILIDGVGSPEKGGTLNAFE
jgi:hypothetical protein